MTRPSPPLQATSRPHTVMALAGRSFFPIALAARLPFAMMIVGVLTLVVVARESIPLGGYTAAVVGITTAVVGPFIGAAADRWGQRRIVLAAGLANAAALGTLAWVAFSPLPDAAVLAAGALIGACAPQVAPMSRARLMALIDTHLSGEHRARATARTMAYESAADEAVFILGPFIVGLLSLLSPVAPLLGAAALALVCVSAFALHRSALPPHAADARPAQGPARALFRPQLLLAVAGVGVVGVVFGTTLTSLTAFLTAQDRPERAALLYGFMGISSAAVALATGWLSPRFALRWRWVVGAVAMTGGTLIFAAAHTDAGFVAALLVMGVGTGPSLVTLFHLGSDLAPLGRTATVMTMMGAALTVGQALSSAATGSLAQSHAVMALPAWGAAVLVVTGLLAVATHARATAPDRG